MIYVKLPEQFCIDNAMRPSDCGNILFSPGRALYNGQIIFVVAPSALQKYRSIFDVANPPQMEEVELDESHFNAVPEE